MTDVFSKAERRRIMQAVRRKGTKPEQIVARQMRRLGIRFRRNAAQLPGCPDFLVPSAQVALFVHGCFWHGHTRCRKGQQRPRSNRPYWAAKIKRNRFRDARAARQLRSMGFAVCVVWECEINKRTIPKRVLARLQKGDREHR